MISPSFTGLIPQTLTTLVDCSKWSGSGDRGSRPARAAGLYSRDVALGKIMVLNVIAFAVGDDVVGDARPVHDFVHR